MNPRAEKSLPEGYTFYGQIDLNRAQQRIVMIIHLTLGLVLIVLGILFAPPFWQTFNTDYPTVLAIKILTVSIGAVLYIIGHEAVHGIVMWQLSHVKPTFGFSIRNGNAFAGSTAYFPKIPYLIVVLAPLVFWGAVLGALCVFLPRDWFWIVYLIQIINLSGAAGDLYVSVRMLRMPSDVLVQDSGAKMKLYAKA